MTRRGVAVTVVAFAYVLAVVADNTAVLAQPSGPPRPTVRDVLKKVTGQYKVPGSSDPKADSVQLLQPPGNPTGSDVRSWVHAHNKALLDSIGGRFTAAEIKQFEAAERTRCTTSVYCQMTFRQQAIAVLLAGQQ